LAGLYSLLGEGRRGAEKNSEGLSFFLGVCLYLFLPLPRLMLLVDVESFLLFYLERRGDRCLAFSCIKAENLVLIYGRMGYDNCNCLGTIEEI